MQHNTRPKGSASPPPAARKLSNPDATSDKLRKDGPYSERVLKMVIGITLLDMICTGLVVPTIPYYAKRLGMQTSAQGTLMSLYGLLQLGGSPILGRLSDMRGRKIVLLISMVGTFISYSMLLFAENEWLFILSRVIVGLLKNTETSCYSIITDISSPSQRVKRMAYIGSAIGLGFIVGPALSGVLTSRYSLETPVYISSTLLALNCIITSIILPETMGLREKTKRAKDSPATSPLTQKESSTTYQRHAPEAVGPTKEEGTDETAARGEALRTSVELIRPPEDEVSLAEVVTTATANILAGNAKAQGAEEAANLSLWKLLWTPGPLRSLVWVYFGTSLATFVFLGSNALLLQLLGLPVQVSSWMISFSGLLTVLSSFVINYLSSRYSEGQLLVKSLFFIAFTLLATAVMLFQAMGMGATLVVSGLLIAYIPLILSSRTLKNCLLGCVTHLAPSTQTGTIIGVLNSIESLSRALVPLFAGVVMDVFHAGGPALLGSLIAFGYAIWVARNPFISSESKSAA